MVKVLEVLLGGIFDETPGCSDATRASKTDELYEPAIPAFQEEWEDEYKNACFCPSIFVFCNVVTGIVHILEGAKGIKGDGTGGDTFWIFATWAPNFVLSVVVHWFSAIIFSSRIRCIRQFCMKYFNLAFLVTMTSVNFLVIFPRMMIEIRRIKFQKPDDPHLHWTIDFSGMLPRTVCVDTDPVKTWAAVRSVSIEAVGCNNFVASAAGVRNMLILHLFPVIGAVSPGYHLLVATINSTYLAAALIATGAHAWVLFSAVGIQVVAASLGIYVGRYRHARSREQFTIAKGIQAAAERNRHLLHTFIPENVAAALAVHDAAGRQEMLGADVQDCTVLFCALEPAAALRAEFTEETFRLLDDIFLEFDRAVIHRGMFKYQHVGDWYHSILCDSL